MSLSLPTIKNELSAYDLISIGGLMVAAVLWGYHTFARADLKLASVQDVTIWANAIGARPVMHFSALMSYLNSSTPDKVAVIQAEFATLTLPGRLAHLNPYPYYFEAGLQAVILFAPAVDGCKASGGTLGEVVDVSDTTKILGCFSNQPRMKLTDISPITRAIAGGGGSSRESLFEPVEGRCEITGEKCVSEAQYLAWSLFMDNLQAGDELWFEFGALLADGTVLRQDCIITIDGVARYDLQQRAIHRFTRCASPEPSVAPVELQTVPAAP